MKLDEQTRLNLITYFAALAIEARRYEQDSPPVTTVGACQGCGKRTRGGGLCPDCLTAVADALEQS